MLACARIVTTAQGGVVAGEVLYNMLQGRVFLVVPFGMECEGVDQHGRSAFASGSEFQPCPGTLGSVAFSHASVVPRSRFVDMA